MPESSTCGGAAKKQLSESDHETHGACELIFAEPSNAKHGCVMDVFKLIPWTSLASRHARAGSMHRGHAMLDQTRAGGAWAYLVELQHAKLDLLVLVLLLLGLGVGLLLPLLGTTHEASQDVEVAVVRHTSLSQHLLILQLLAGEEHTQLGGIDA